MRTTGPSPAPAPLPNLFGLDRMGLASALAPYVGKPFHAAQVFRQMYGRLEPDLPAMSDLPSALRRELAARFRIGWPAVRQVRQSADGSRKYLLALDDGGEIESVYIVYGERVTLCLS